MVRSTLPPGRRLGNPGGPPDKNALGIVYWHFRCRKDRFSARGAYDSALFLMRNSMVSAIFLADNGLYKARWYFGAELWSKISKISKFRFFIFQMNFWDFELIEFEFLTHFSFRCTEKNVKNINFSKFQKFTISKFQVGVRRPPPSAMRRVPQVASFFVVAWPLSLQAVHTETMVDGLPCAVRFRAFWSRFGFLLWILTIVFGIRPSDCWEICAGGFGWAVVSRKIRLKQNLVRPRSGAKFEISKISWYLAAGDPFTCPKITKCSRWREFQCLAGPPRRRIEILVSVLIQLLFMHIYIYIYVNEC